MILPIQTRFNSFENGERPDWQIMKDNSKSVADSMNTELLSRLEQSEIFYIAQLQQFQKLAEQSQTIKECERVYTEYQKFYLAQLQKLQAELENFRIIQGEQTQPARIERAQKLLADSALMASHRLFTTNQPLISTVNPNTDPITHVIGQTPWVSPNISPLSFINTIPASMLSHSAFVSPFNLTTNILPAVGGGTTNISMTKGSQEQSTINLTQAVPLPSPESQVVPSISPREDDLQTFHEQQSAECKKARFTYMECKEQKPCSTNGVSLKKNKITKKKMIRKH